MRIDDLFERLRIAPRDAHLDQLESAVWARIGAPGRAAPVWGLRATAFAALLMIGLFTGAQLAAVNSTEMAPFSADARLAPSTLLAGQK